MKKAVVSHQKQKVNIIRKGKPDLRYNPNPPKGGLVLRVTTKILGGYENTQNEYRKIMQRSIGRDNLWITSKEKEALKKDEIPESFLRRLIRFHLVDNTRGEPSMWKKEDIRKVTSSLVDGKFNASVSLRNQNGDRGFETTLKGIIKLNKNEITQFDLVAKGLYWGEGTYTRNAPKNRFPLAVAFTLADGRNVTDEIPPQGSRGWVKGYIDG